MVMKPTSNRVILREFMASVVRGQVLAAGN
jgi:hypothetical protein